MSIEITEKEKRIIQTALTILINESDNFFKFDEDKQYIKDATALLNKLKNGARK